MDFTPKKVIKEMLLDYDNIKTYYDPDRPNAYPHELFSFDEDLVIKNYNKFVRYSKKCNENPYEHILYMLPSVIEYADYELGPDYVLNWIQECRYSVIFGNYGLYISEYDFMVEYKNYILDIYFDKTARKIAINKLKRNKIVNEGILLKLSMKNCGLF
jgi:hypothetical protein